MSHSIEKKVIYSFHSYLPRCLSSIIRVGLILISATTFSFQNKELWIPNRDESMYYNRSGNPLMNLHLFPLALHVLYIQHKGTWHQRTVHWADLKVHSHCPDGQLVHLYPIIASNTEIDPSKMPISVKSVQTVKIEVHIIECTTNVTTHPNPHPSHILTNRTHKGLGPRLPSF